MFWYDKPEAQARNNRAVNISKLRTLMADVGHCNIIKSDNHWKIVFDKEVFVDYYECLPQSIRPDSLTPDRVTVISAMTARGSLLSDLNYLWLDAYKSQCSNGLIDSLLKYASLLDDHSAFETRLSVADIIFRFDTVNESALRLKCLTYMALHKRYMAKMTYEHFCREYKALYGEDFQLSFNSILEH